MEPARGTLGTVADIQASPREGIDLNGRPILPRRQFELTAGLFVRLVSKGKVWNDDFFWFC